MREDQLPAPQPHACSVLSAELGEPLAGTAATQSAWLLLEQPGPWGRVAATESRLDPELGAEIEGRTRGTGVRVALIRRSENGHEHTPGLRRWYAASTHPDRAWLATGVVAFPTDLLLVDFAALDRGDRSAVAALEHEFRTEPFLGVCTNGRRDQCCATVGRKVAVAADALESAAAAPGTLPAVWEITHLGGHKFSPTGVLLPYGYLYGRMTAPLAVRVLAEARKEAIVLEGCRGRTTWSRAGQAAELALRAEIGERGASALTVASVAEGDGSERGLSWTVVLEHVDGRAFEVSVRGASALVPRPESCGKAEGTPLELRVDAIDKIR